tara:strand:- start:141 stop:395 length:255 start_codon:yes stop_codon:yes gene_type:complete
MKSLMVALTLVFSLSAFSQNLSIGLLDMEMIDLKQEAIDVKHGFEPSLSFEAYKQELENIEGIELTNEEAADLIIERAELEEIL